MLLLVFARRNTCYRIRQTLHQQQTHGHVLSSTTGNEYIQTSMWPADLEGRVAVRPSDTINENGARSIGSRNTPSLDNAALSGRNKVTREPRRPVEQKSKIKLNDKTVGGTGGTSAPRKTSTSSCFVGVRELCCRKTDGHSRYPQHRPRLQGGRAAGTKPRLGQRRNKKENASHARSR